MGSHVIETILQYSKSPAPGPYREVHNTALLTVPSAGDVKLYIPYDGTVLTSTCGGRASTFNFTAHYCASNGTIGGQVLQWVLILFSRSDGRRAESTARASYITMADVQ